MKKFYALLMTAVLLLSTLLTALPVKAITPIWFDFGGNPTKTVTLHKLLMSKDELDAFKTPDAYDGTQDLAGLQALVGGGQTLKEIEGVYFAWQNEQGQWVDANGQVVTDVKDALGGKTTATGIEFDTSRLIDKVPAHDVVKFKIVEVDELSTYVDPATKAILADSKAVPVEITLPLLKPDGQYAVNAHVYPKNTQEVPTLDKKVEGQDEANGKLGQELTYTVTSTIKAGSRYKTLAYKDTMSNGLTMIPGVTITEKDGKVSLDQGTDYTLLQDDRGFSLTLTAAGLKKVSDVTNPAGGNNGEDVNFTITYKARINANAVVREKNVVKVDYSNEPSETVEATPITPDPATGDLNVTKKWQAADGSEIPVPAGQSLVYTLYKADVAVATVQLDNASQVGSVINLGNGITFTVTAPFSGTFKGLEKGAADYTLSERISGYTPSYESTAGNVTVTNKKNKIPEIVAPADAFVNLFGKKFVKVDSQTAARLQGAQFVIQKENGQYLAFESAADQATQQQDLVDKKAALDRAVATYNALAAEAQTAEERAKVTAAQEAYNAAYVAAKIVYTEVTDKNASNVVKLTSNEQGQFEIAGLETGTYKLVEVVAPKGYALNTGAITFKADTVNDFAYIEGGATDAIRVNNVKLSIPQTGGMGTVIFAVTGAALMGLALYAYKKNNKEEDAA